MTTASLTLQEYADLLASCESVDDVATLLRMYEVRGRRESPCDCPVAVLGTTLIDHAVCVAEFSMAHDNDDDVRGPLPYCASNFVYAFDHGAYPDLEAA